MKKLTLACVAALLTAGAQAQTYGEIGYTATTAKENVDGDGIKASPSALRGILGYELNPNLAIEAMVAFGMSDSTVKLNGQSIPGVKLEIDNAIGLYVKPKTNLNDNVVLFGRLGFARVEGSASAVGYGSETGSESSFSYGAGISYAINPSVSISTDYMQYLSKDGFKITGFTFGISSKF